MENVGKIRYAIIRRKSKYLFYGCEETNYPCWLMNLFQSKFRTKILKVKKICKGIFKICHKLELNNLNWFEKKLKYRELSYGNILLNPNKQFYRNPSSLIKVKEKLILICNIIKICKTIYFNNAIIILYLYS